MPSLRDALLAGLAVAGLVLAAAANPGTAFIAWSLPFQHALIEMVDPEVEVLSLGLANSGGRTVVRLRADLARPIVLRGRRLRPLQEMQGWSQIDVTRGGLLQHAVLLLAVALGWPARTLRRRVARLAAAVPLSGFLFSLTFASTFLAEFWAPFHADMGDDADPLMLDWSQFLMGGGGAMLAIAVAAALVLTTDRRGRADADSSSP
jgi:hypothetical protein